MKKGICGIYCIKNTANGKVYIGQSICVETQLAGHFSELRNRHHYNTHLQAAFNKYGEPCFEKRLLEETQAELLDIRERTWIAQYGSDNSQQGYNKESGGSGGKRHSDETKRKMSIAASGRVLSSETREKIGAAHRGMICSEEKRTATRNTLAITNNRPEVTERRRIAQLGRTHPQEIKDKIGVNNKGKHPITQEHQIKLQEARRLNPIGESTRALMSAARKGRVISEESKRRMSESKRQWWATRKRTTSLPELNNVKEVVA